MQKTMEKKNFTPVIGRQEKLEGREALLAVLARAADDSEFMAKMGENPTKAIGDYYSLNHEELAALISGDIRRIEGWLGKLDNRHATWLLARLGQESW